MKGLLLLSLLLLGRRAVDGVAYALTGSLSCGSALDSRADIGVSPREGEARRLLWWRPGEGSRHTGGAMLPSSGMSFSENSTVVVAAVLVVFAWLSIPDDDGVETDGGRRTGL